MDTGTERIRGIMLAVLPLAAIVVGWEALARSGQLNLLFSSPTSVASALRDLMETTTKGGYPVLLYHTAFSLYALAISLVVAVVAGVSLGAIAGVRATLYRFIDPLVTLVMPIPGIAWAPIFLIWFGFGLPTIVAVGCLVSFFPIFYNTAAGVRSVDESLLRAARIMGADRRSIFLRVLLPGAAAYIMTGVKLGFAKGWRTIIAVEMIASSLWGLGFMIFDARDYLQPSVIYGGIIVLVIVYIFLEQVVVHQIERRTVMRWGMAREGSL
ncbi:MAG: ABC transporter permease [Candidatus Methanofastidiosa archaeon]|nr:ABC transporter permease [Candidatus Methanofastidiosa archaeon]